MFGLMYAKDSSKCGILSYDDFLKNIDEKSKKRLEELDASIEAYREELSKEGFVLEECSCEAPNIRILRNQFGFYVDESHALDSKESYELYRFGLDFYRGFSKKFSVLNRILLEKEYIMNGNYHCKKSLRPNLDSFSASMGYGNQRLKQIYEENPDHPSQEYQRLVIILDVLSNNYSTDRNDIIAQCMDKLNQGLKPRYRIELKRSTDKYDKDFDDSCGVLALDLELGEMEMIYEFDGLNIHKRSYEKYFFPNKPYIEIYLRIITYCLKDELMYDFKGEKGLF